MKSEVMTHYKEATNEKKATLTRKNLISLTIFLLVSIWAYTFKDFHICDAVPVYLHTLLGTPPPAFLVSIALVGYFFSALVLTFTAITKNLEPIPKLDHLGYRVTFFMFYAFSGAIAPNFLPVFLIGLCLYSLDQYQIWAYNFILYLIFIHPTAIHFVGQCEACIK